jgi:hypothetical protein
MKRLSLTALLLIVLSTGAFAHQGSLGLYTDMSATDCDVTFVPYLGYDITIMYFRSDAGPDGITAAEFKLEVPATMVIQSFTKSPAVSVTLGDLATGLAASFQGCAGSGDDYTFIGTASVLSLADVPSTLKIVASETIELPPYEPRVSMCDDPARTIVGVLGGWFTSPDGTCSVGTETTTWGAIKNMYTD